MGRLPSGSVGVFETDEATIPEAAAAHAPRALVITNLMRDQLDRYGEIEAIRERWVAAIERLTAETVLVLNADDPSVATLAEVAPGPVVLFGIEDPGAALPPGVAERQARDALWDAGSGVDFVYDRRFYAHLGHWQCPGIGRRRPRPDVRAVAIETRAGGLRFAIEAGSGDGGALAVALGLEGTYNVYNALAAFAAARVLEVPAELAASTLGSVRAAFGRQEDLVVDGHRVRLLLGKNPTGMNEALRTLPGRGLHLLVLLNDGLADGRDVSWIWDTDWEGVAPKVASVVVGGRRAADMALRLEYAGFPPPRLAPGAAHDVRAAIETALEALPAGAALYVLPTYTAMLEVRDQLGRRAGAQRIWEGA